MRLLLTLTALVIFTSIAEAKIIMASTLGEAIAMSNTINGKDSLYLSDFNWNLTEEETPQQYNISDQLVLINDMGENAKLLQQDVVFKIAITGSLQLIGFNMVDFDSRFINLGKISLENCTFQEGKDLTRLITNKGLFAIRKGKFEGHKDGTIIRDAEFKVGTAVIL